MAGGRRASPRGQQRPVHAPMAPRPHMPPASSSSRLPHQHQHQRQRQRQQRPVTTPLRLSTLRCVRCPYPAPSETPRRCWSASCTRASRAVCTPLALSSQLESHLDHTGGGYPAFCSAASCHVSRLPLPRYLHHPRGTWYLVHTPAGRHLAKDPKYPGRPPQPCLLLCPHSPVLIQPDPFVSPCY